MNNSIDMEQNVLGQNFNGLSLFKFALPCIIMMVFAGLYTIIDTIFVARFVNSDALSSINIVCPIINMIVGIGTMLATGGNAIVARKMGAGETKRACQDFTLIIITGIVIGVLITGGILIFLDKVVWALGASTILFPYCRDYLFILILFTPASLLQVLFQNLFVTAGKAGLGMVLSFVAGIVNIILDYVFIVLCDMGISGAAFGTGIGYMVPTVIGIIFFCKKEGNLYFCKPVIDKSVITESCSNGASEMVSQLATAVTTFFFNISMMRLCGESGVAAITIIIYSQFLLSSLYIGYAMGVAPIISFNYGSKNYHMLKKVYSICLKFISVVSLIVCACSFLLGKDLVAIFSPSGDKVYNLASKGFEIFSFSFIFCGFNIFASASFTALSNGKVSAVIAFLRTFVFIMAGLLILPIIWGVRGVWVTIPLAESITFIIAVILIILHKEEYKYL